MNRYSPCLLLLLIFLVTTTCQGKIGGVVQDRDGADIEGAKIEIERISLDTPEPVTKLITSEDGSFFKQGLKSGLYLVSAQTEWFAKIGQIVELCCGISEEINPVQ